MDYKNKHKEEIIRATQLWECGDITRENLEYIFPELAESEDEKIRKELIQFIKNWKDHNNIGRPHDFPTLTRNVEQCDRYIAWLEKQKEFVSADFDDVWDTADCDELTAPLEQYSKDAIKEMCHAWYDKGIELERKSWLEKQGEQRSKLVGFDYNAKDSDLQEVTYFIPNGFHAEIDGDKVVIKQGEQKPAEWSYEDEANLNNIIWLCNNCLNGAETTWIPSQAEKIKHLIERIKERGLTQQKMKWTDDDEHPWMMCLECVEECATQEREDFSKTIDWLKSLKQRLQ